jgi:hypothetical protein
VRKTALDPQETWPDCGRCGAAIPSAYDTLFGTDENHQVKAQKRSRTAFAATGAACLTHTIGKSDPCETILTAEELCTRLERLREGGYRPAAPRRGSN